VVGEFVAILWFFTKQKLQNISGDPFCHLAVKMAAALPSLFEMGLTSAEGQKLEECLNELQIIFLKLQWIST